MRVPFEILQKGGVRLTPYSKYYIYDDMLFEPVYRNGKKCKNYKAIEKSWRVRELLRNSKKKIPKVSEIDPDFSIENLKRHIEKKTKKVENRFELMDLE